MFVLICAHPFFFTFYYNQSQELYDIGLLNKLKKEKPKTRCGMAFGRRLLNESFQQKHIVACFVILMLRIAWNERNVGFTFLETEANKAIRDNDANI